MKRPSQLYDHAGRAICLGPEFKRGGEGAVFEVSGLPDIVAKLYHKSPSPEKSDKLRCMVRNASADILSAVAWPTATLHEVLGGKVSGILMRRVVEYREIHTLYSPAHRNQTFPRADWAFLIRVARNCAITFATLHRHGHVIGDVNQSNVLVSNQATVTLIDCDSFQVSDGRRVFRCEVGVPLFTPPELHGRNFRDVERSSIHDDFGLAVLIFHLLFMGRHPYSGRFLGKGEMPLERAIEETRFAFSKNAASRQMSAPPNCPTLNLVPTSLANLFERAFGEEAKRGHGRPSPQEWDSALGELERQLKHCRSDLGHRYSGHLPSCPWCELIQIGAPNFFVCVAIITNPQGQATAFQLETFWIEVEKVAPPPALYSRPTPQTNCVSPTPLPPSAIPGPRPPIQRSVIQTTVGWIAIAAVVLMIPTATRIFGINIFGTFSIWWCICKWMGLKQFDAENQPWVRARSELGKEHSRRQKVLRDLTSQFEGTENSVLDLLSRSVIAFDKCKADLREAKSKFLGIENVYQEEKRRLEKAKRDFQLQQFLERHFIRDAKLDNIGPSRLAQLESYGVETAAEISEAVLSLVPGFGPKLCGTLIAFRRSVEARFRFDPKAAIPPAEFAALNSRFAAARRDHEVRLLAGLRALREITPKLLVNLEPLNLSVHGLAIRLAQAEADVAVSKMALALADDH